MGKKGLQRVRYSCAGAIGSASSRFDLEMMYPRWCPPESVQLDKAMRRTANSAMNFIRTTPLVK